jgi:hypothetical protein
VSDQLVLPNGEVVGTGLLIPETFGVTAFPEYADPNNGPMFQMDTIKQIAANTPKNGRKWFDRTFIKNQRSHGSCQGFASAAMVTRARIRRGLERVDLSGAFAYSLVNRGRDDGSILEEGMVACQGGYATEETVGWDAIYPSRYDVPKAKAEAARFKAFEVYAVRTEQALFSALAAGFDCVVAVHADNGFMVLDGNGIAGGGNGPGNHAVGADGLYITSSGQLVADGVNSWDLTYGDNGRMGLTWARHFAPTCSYHVYYAIRSASDDPQGEKPPTV